MAFISLSLGTLLAVLGGAAFVLLCWFFAVCIEQANIGRDIDDSGGGK